MMICLIVNGEVLPEPDEYSVDTEDVLRESSGEKENGHTQRDIARKDVYKISAGFNVTKKWLKKLKVYKSEHLLHVELFDPEEGEMKGRTMYIDSFSSELLHPTSYGGVWKVQMAFKEY